ncbi:MAG: hypothetical protein IJ229_00745 [Clostridia bacterium]|nr:hypothetical protein [Clostridia bacterium]
MIGRAWERQELLRRYQRNKAEFIAVYGRRGVGKTCLVDNTLEGKITFRHTALSPAEDEKTGELSRQLSHFWVALQRYHVQTDHCPKSWMEAFYMLEVWLEAVDDGSRQVVFLDELPWLDTPRSHFLSALESFWNNWGCHRNNFMLVVCGSASSWIIDHLINNHGGLYDRLTYHMKLSPFTLRECEQFFEERQMAFSRYDIAQGVMMLGGIPSYLDAFTPELSLTENIDRLLFFRHAALKEEWDRLFASTFQHPTAMKAIVRVLSTRRGGLTRNEIALALGYSSGGTLSGCLKALVESDLVVRFVPFGRKKSEAHYLLTDPFCLFYLQWLEGPHKQDAHFWSKNVGTEKARSFQKVAFENLCFQHMDQIKRALDIFGVETTQSAWFGDEETAGPKEVELLVDRKDHVVNMCEMNFLSGPLSVDKAYYLKLLSRQTILAGKLSPKIVIYQALITTHGVTYNAYSGIFSRVITLDDLFA